MASLWLTRPLLQLLLLDFASHFPVEGVNGQGNPSSARARSARQAVRLAAPAREL